MIRHRADDEFFLITQHDHALLSGRLAEHLSGNPIRKPSPQAIQGIALHDCGWPLHDDEPTLNSEGLPLHVFETPPAISTKVWSASASRTANKEPYSGLLVSLHVLSLSFMSQASHRSPHDVFELNKFQHRQVELQEELRTRLDMRIDLPLTHGLAQPGTSTQEDALLFDFYLLKMMDVLSLAVCCSEDLSVSLENVFPHPGSSPIHLHLARPRALSATLNPWPFDTSPVEFPVPFRRTPARAYASVEEFRGAYAAARSETVGVRVSAG